MSPTTLEAHGLLAAAPGAQQPTADASKKISGKLYEPIFFEIMSLKLQLFQYKASTFWQTNIVDCFSLSN